MNWGMGRPKRTDETAKTSFVLPVGMLDELRVFCQDHSIGRSRFIERAVRELLDRHRADGDPTSAQPWDWRGR